VCPAGCGALQEERMVWQKRQKRKERGERHIGRAALPTVLRE